MTNMLSDKDIETELQYIGLEIEEYNREIQELDYRIGALLVKRDDARTRLDQLLAVRKPWDADFGGGSVA